MELQPERHLQHQFGCNQRHGQAEAVWEILDPGYAFCRSQRLITCSNVFTGCFTLVRSANVARWKEDEDFEAFKSRKRMRKRP
jgi:hypothetical protein